MALTPEQLAARKRGIGASEIAAVMGLDPFKTALDVFLDKRDLLPPQDETEPMYWGSAIEPVIFDRYGREMTARGEVGAETSRFALGGGGMRLIRHPEHSFVTCTPDGAVIEVDTDTVDTVLCWGVEIKNKSAYVAHQWGESGSTDVPFYVQLQAQWSMLACGVDRWDVAVLIGGNDFRLYTLTGNPTVQADLLAVATEFWQNVEQGIEPTASAEDNAKLARLKRQQDETMLPSNPNLDEYAKSLAHAREQIKVHERTKNEMEAIIKQNIGESAGVAGADWKATWRTSKPSLVVDWQRLAIDALTLLGAKLPPKAIAEMRERCTTERPGTRRFLFTPAKSEE